MLIVSEQVSRIICNCRLYSLSHTRVNFHDDENMKPMPIKAVVTLRSASERFVVAALLMIWVSSDSLLRSSPVRVTSKNAISCRILFKIKIKKNSTAFLLTMPE